MRHTRTVMAVASPPAGFSVVAMVLGLLFGLAACRAERGARRRRPHVRDAEVTSADTRPESRDTEDTGASDGAPDLPDSPEDVADTAPTPPM